MVEAIVALSILVIFLSGATRVILMRRQVADKNSAHYTAINIAKNQIEQVRNLRRLDYDQILEMTEDGVRVNEDGDPDVKGKFKRTTQITIHTTLLLEIEVSVQVFNPITLDFGIETEHVKSFMAKLL